MPDRPEGERATKDADRDAPNRQSSATPMERFKSLARRLINVPRVELNEERRRHESKRSRD
jgi:hypothetical protein